MAVVAGTLLVLVVLWEAFETLVLPRRVDRRLRLTRLYFRGLWRGWSAIGRGHPGRRRESYLSVYAPLSLLVLFGLWAAGVILGFGLIEWGLRIPVATDRATGLETFLYYSATTFWTLGLGDVAPMSSLGRAVTVVEAGLGFAFLALAISYLPVLYQAFSRREVRISMLDEWAGSPPSAVELLRRSAAHGRIDSVDALLADWERWAAELLESHLSYPILAYFRSQHDNQSWLAALTSILDVSALALSGVDGVSSWQARRTFAIARHAVVDLAQVLTTRPLPAPVDRLPRERLPEMRRLLAAAQVRLGTRAEERWRPYRHLYEPYLQALSHQLQMPLPSLLPPGDTQDDWQTSGWDLPS